MFDNTPPQQATLPSSTFDNTAPAQVGLPNQQFGNAAAEPFFPKAPDFTAAFNAPNIVLNAFTWDRTMATVDETAVFETQVIPPGGSQYQAIGVDIVISAFNFQSGSQTFLPVASGQHQVRTRYKRGNQVGAWSKVKTVNAP